MLMAILVTFLAWRAVRRSNERARAAMEERLAPRTYTLDAHEDATGHGFVIRNADGSELHPLSLEWEKHGLKAVSVAGAAVAGEELEAQELEDVAARAQVDVPDVGSAVVLWVGASDTTVLLIHRDVGMEDG